MYIYIYRYIYISEVLLRYEPLALISVLECVFKVMCALEPSICPCFSGL